MEGDVSKDFGVHVNRDRSAEFLSLPLFVSLAPDHVEEGSFFFGGLSAFSPENVPSDWLGDQAPEVAASELRDEGSHFADGWRVEGG